MSSISDISHAALRTFRRGCVIPAMPLALDAERRFDERHQRALLRYYLDAGVGGVAVGVHSTQFEIRDPEIGLYEPVLKLAAEEIDAVSEAKSLDVLKIAGVAGATTQAISEANTVVELGYDAALVSLAALGDATEYDLVQHCAKVAEIVPIVGFYLQPAVGGRALGSSFWREFALIENVLGIKIAPFDRYRTIDVVRGVVEAKRENEIVLYTGNDDTIVQDLVTRYRVRREGSDVMVRIRGGLLGHWGFWTKRAVELLEQIHAIIDNGLDVPLSLLSTGAEITDVNGAVFDPAHGFAGCIPGIHEMLARQGLLAGRYCLDESCDLSPGQLEEIERVHRAYPHLNDFEFVRSHINEWLTD